MRRGEEPQKPFGWDDLVREAEGTAKALGGEIGRVMKELDKSDDDMRGRGLGPTEVIEVKEQPQLRSRDDIAFLKLLQQEQGESKGKDDKGKNDDNVSTSGK